MHLGTGIERQAWQNVSTYRLETLMKLARLPLVVSIFALALLLIGGPGYRLGLWGLGFGLLDVMRYALFAGAAGALLAIVFLIIPKTRTGHVPALLLAIVIGGIVATIPVVVRGNAQDHPIHDITTNPDDPPAFVEILPLRADAPNPAAYGGPDVAAIQRETYPDLQPLRSDARRADMIEIALQVARDMGWEIIAADTPAGRIEAVDTTFWYGFKDDIVVLVTGEDRSLQLDVRSKSRVGRSDMGKNAERIREYLQNAERKLTGS